MIKHWTPEEEETLLRLKAEKVKLAEIAAQLGRSLESVKTRSKRLNYRLPGFTPKPSVWLESEIDLLYDDLDYDELEKVLPYSRRAIMTQCEKRGISKRYHIDTVGTMYPDKPALLYLVDFGDFKKVGVTQVSLETRFKQDKPFKVLDQFETTLDEALEWEKEILRNMRPYAVVGDIRRGFNECFNFEGSHFEDLFPK